MPIAMDLDDEVVAIYDEGKSFSPHQVASYFAQVFHTVIRASRSRVEVEQPALVEARG